ncbi:hypothetical protein DPMN_113505 [Dreissena polymorpha]|uniref:Uncharacterized protein n=1 Tax=Dreissena polymorpha TaxID=45954 RepID=A0A9D4KIE6_DREPO|nr:hypothetical protein DPMN_113505 [Dreissena polymorpha]
MNIICQHQFYRRERNEITRIKIYINDAKYSPRLSTSIGRFQFFHPCRWQASIIIRSNLLTRKNAQPPPPDGHVFQPTRTIFKLVENIIGTDLQYKAIEKETGTIFELIQESISTNVLTKFHKDWTINVIFRVKKAAMFFNRFVKDIIETDLLSKIHENGTINVASRASPPGGHVFQQTRIILELSKDFDEDRTINLASLVHIWKNAPPYDIIGTNIVTKKNTPPAGGHVFQPTGRIELVQDIIGTNLLTTFHDDSTINVAYRVHITKNAPPPGGHVFQPTRIIFQLVQNIIGTNLLTNVHKNQTINVASRVFTMKNAPPPGGNVFQATVTIFELVQDIVETNDLTKFHDDYTINVSSIVLTRQLLTPHDAQRKTDKKRQQRLTISTLCLGELKPTPSPNKEKRHSFPSSIKCQQQT